MGEQNIGTACKKLVSAAEAPKNADGEKLGIFGGLHIGRGVADIKHLVLFCAKTLDNGIDRCGIGLERIGARLPCDKIEIVASVKPLGDLACGKVGLV